MAASAGTAIVSTYPPRACGLATFSRDLLGGLRRADPTRPLAVAAIDRTGERLAYAPPVRLLIEEGEAASYVAAARRLSADPAVAVVSIQHDFGKFGVWRDGFEADYLVPMLDALRVPAVLTLHSVPRRPNRLMRDTFQHAATRAAAVVVMAAVARDLLRDDYGLDAAALAKVRVLPHGVSDACPTDAQARAAAKRALGLAGRTVLSTFGLLGAGKGIEVALAALPPLVARHPDLCYLVLGRTHPEVRRREGEAYREALQAQCRDLGMERHVCFVDRYLDDAELLRALAATDVYLTPYLAPDQITSGALAFALGCGKAIVSTPYLYAKEALADGRGLFAAFRDPAALADAVGRILDQPALRAGLETRAAALGREMRWSAVAVRYGTLFDAIARNWWSGAAIEEPKWPAADTATIGRSVAAGRSC